MEPGTILDLKHEGEKLEVLHSALAGGERFEFIWTVNPRCGPPVHSHTRETEQVEVLEGEVDFWMGGRLSRLKAGDHAVIPNGARHRLRGAGRVPCRIRVAYDGSDMERTFAELAPGDLRGFVRMVRHCVVEDFESLRLASPPLRTFFRALSATGRLLGIHPLHARPPGTPGGK